MAIGSCIDNVKTNKLTLTTSKLVKDFCLLNHMALFIIVNKNIKTVNYGRKSQLQTGFYLV